MATLLPADLSDIPIIRTIAFETWPVAYGHILSPEQMKYMLEMMYSEAALTAQINERGHQFFLAKTKDEIAGFMSVEKNETPGGSCILHKLYVLPSCQGKQLGKTLLNHAIELAKTNEAASLILNVNRDNPALHFYQKSGFKILEEKDIDIGGGYFMNDYILQFKIS